MAERVIQFIGTSHIRALEEASRSRPSSDWSLRFTAVGAPLLRVLLNRARLRIDAASLQWEVPDPEALFAVFEQLDSRFTPMRLNLERVLGAPHLVQALPSGSVVVFVDPLVRYSPYLHRVQLGAEEWLYRFRDQPITLSALSRLTDLAGEFHAFVEPFHSRLPFDPQGSRSVFDLMEAVHQVAADLSIWIWRSPDFFGNKINLEAHDRLHAWRLQDGAIPCRLIPIPLQLLDPATGSALAHYRGRPGHGNAAFGVAALDHIFRCVQTTDAPPA
jgi:hypothetical protein